MEIEVISHANAIPYAVLMIVVIIAVDSLFLKNRFWGRLTVNIAIVLVFAALYFRFLKRP